MKDYGFYFMHKLVPTNFSVIVNIYEIIFILLTFRLDNANIILLSETNRIGGAYICL